VGSGEEKNRKIGLAASAIVHMLLLILFAFFGLSYMEPPPEEEGITINFGIDDFGKASENDKPPTESSENTPAETVPETPSPTESVQEDLITQDTDEATSIDQKKEEKQEKPVEEKKEEPQVNKKLNQALNKWKKSNQEAGGGDGTTDKTGDQGDLKGDPNSNNYQGGGLGNGTSFSLSGRSLISSPKITDNSQEEGKVVVEIIVDKYGNVVRASPGARGSTTTNSTLYKKAKEAALKTKFDANPNAAEEQKGSMTFIFILN